MKRASLKTAKVPVTPSSGGPDVTDRILNRGDAPKLRAKALRAPKAKKETAPDPLAFVPYRPIPEPPPAPPPGPQPTPPQPQPLPRDADSLLRAAMQKTQAAVEALQAAARTGPGKYDLGVRYRLDALARHVEQVAEFLAGPAKP